MPHKCEPPELIHCPRGCGFVTLAQASLKHGPWRMQVHTSFPRCNPPAPGASSQYTYDGGYRPPALRKPTPC